ncbi:NADP-dependent oxidoreductase [Pseudohaliea sp.]|uniref:NADP-dependent oxidoreductase n=1 Tax=Pseudohaliea sp. TaxID=2740289 RepID=UPI0032EE1149
MSATMRQWVVARRPEGRVSEADFRLEEAPRPEPGPGEVLLRTQYLGVAPVMLRYLSNETGFERPLAIGDVMHGRGVGIVVGSRHPDYAEGDAVQCKLGWREYGLIDGADPYFMPLRMGHPDLRLSYGISSLALSGFTALIGLRDIGRLRAGDRLLVSGAAGGVGSQVAFMARALGCATVVGIAGGPEKCALLTDRLGYDAAIDYKEDDLPARLDALFPEGVDVFFDNVGGELLDEVLGRIRRRARIAVCGRISEYLKTPEEYHRPRNLYRIGLMDAKLEGFFVYDWEPQFRELEETIAGWIRSGALSPLEDIDEGIERMPAALISLYEGSNAGVRMVRIDPAADGGA